MSRRALCATLIAAALATAVAGPARADGPEDLQLLGTRQLSARLVELTFKTPALADVTHVRILLPDGYDAAAARRYPVLWLLNGALDDETSWTVKGDAERITAGFGLIVVMPDGGEFGNYTDWFNDGRGGPPMWESYHLRELLPWIDGHYATVATRAGRAVAGLSMGGGGAAAYAARHPDLFAAMAAFSGAVDTNNLEVQPLTETAGIGQGAAPGAVYGHRTTDEVRWRGHNAWDLAENLDGVDVTLRTGNGLPGGPYGDLGDPVEMGVHEQSVSLHRRLQSLGVAHVWDDYGAGGHSWPYWQRDLVRTLPGLMETFGRRARARPPSPFTYTAIDPSYEVYGWRVDVDRPALEFSTLRDARPAGFAVQGSGTATVASPRVYAPRARLRVTTTAAAGAEERVVRAGDDGRLRLKVTLGPGNAHQQYSPQAMLTGGVQTVQESFGTTPAAAGRTLSYTTHVRVAVIPRPTKKTRK